MFTIVFLLYLLASPFLFASMMRKAAKDKFPIWECAILSFCNLLLFFAFSFLLHPN